MRMMVNGCVFALARQKNQWVYLRLVERGTAAPRLGACSRMLANWKLSCSCFSMESRQRLYFRMALIFLLTIFLATATLFAQGTRSPRERDFR
ncbi:hypothetical protein Q31a_52170 [Aureliella helgolandensis]|uniref:Uncharacterized protein n=1 Tax=Aureliella helgolandensis TaxID=2527968 RepID=A0A518GE69_9BACT|nr:hypothetical protein Q31a_52170 [Aureliella helgolandensis]